MTPTNAAAQPRSGLSFEAANESGNDDDSSVLTIVEGKSRRTRSIPHKSSLAKDKRHAVTIQSAMETARATTREEFMHALPVLALKHRMLLVNELYHARRSRCPKFHAVTKSSFLTMSKHWQNCASVWNFRSV